MLLLFRRPTPIQPLHEPPSRILSPGPPFSTPTTISPSRPSQLARLKSSFNTKTTSHFFLSLPQPRVSSRFVPASSTQLLSLAEAFSIESFTLLLHPDHAELACE